MNRASSAFPHCGSIVMARAIRVGVDLLWQQDTGRLELDRCGQAVCVAVQTPGTHPPRLYRIVRVSTLALGRVAGSCGGWVSVWSLAGVAMHSSDGVTLVWSRAPLAIVVR